MEDILFDKDNQVVEAGVSTRTHQQDLLLMHKGWNKFYPHMGVGIMDYIGEERGLGQVKSNISYEMERDGMTVKEIALDNTGKLRIYADY